jgi:CRP/FNR family transcriptional regulator, cyclic AMP receptor protein
MSPAVGGMDLSMFNRFSKTFRKGDIIFCEYEPGDAFYLIQSGRVQIVRIIGDLEKNIDILNPTEVFGEMAILEEAPRSATAIALDDVKALEFNRENFEVLMMGNPQIAMKLLKLFVKRIYDQKRRFMILTLDDVEAKVADVFLMLTESQGIDISTQDAIDFKTTVDDMSHWAGIPPGQCREVLNHFVAQRKIELFPDRIVVKNINDFVRFVNTRRKNQAK